jgi:type II secretory pathway pseudopilin PulG
MKNLIHSSKQSGFTVMEVVLTTAIAGFILLGITAMINSLNSINDRARDLTLANALAENKAESLRSISFTGLVNGTYDFSNELPAELTGPTTASYVVTDAVDPATSTAMTNVKQVDISITYQETGIARSLEYTTYIGELGVGQY